ncbi:glycine-rich RNA-binding protein blt801-like [Quercus lobata]|uniref:glycine-rich RNA-binding protein blt801-like n=1 Tax=Quercus lobata TaxID=97700 RepID=UPI00124474FA|nr:glycine-rich RNA-binding protein blt801-like [Quercus lobata]
MIVEDERDDNEVVDLDYEQIDGVDNPSMQVLREQSDGFMSYIESGRVSGRGHGGGRVSDNGGGIGGGIVGGGGRVGRGGGSDCGGSGRVGGGSSNGSGNGYGLL